MLGLVWGLPCLFLRTASDAGQVFPDAGPVVLVSGEGVGGVVKIAVLTEALDAGHTLVAGGCGGDDGPGVCSVACMVLPPVAWPAGL